MIYLQDFVITEHNFIDGYTAVGYVWKDGMKHIVRCAVSFKEEKIYLDNPFIRQKMEIPLSQYEDFEGNLTAFVTFILLKSNSKEVKQKND